MPDATHKVAAFYDDPSGRFRYRFWDGARWTERVLHPDGVEHSDPIRHVDPTEQLHAARLEPDEPPWEEMRDALTAYSRLCDDFQARRIDEVTLRREAVRAGVVVKGGSAWIIDLVNQRWHYYDGIQVRTLQLTEAQD